MDHANFVAYPCACMADDLSCSPYHCGRVGHFVLRLVVSHIAAYSFSRSCDPFVLSFFDDGARGRVFVYCDCAGLWHSVFNWIAAISINEEACDFSVHLGGVDCAFAAADFCLRSSFLFSMG